MILYATKQTIERYKLKMPAELTPPMNMLAQAVVKKESGDKLLEWGAKLFYFDRRKCIQLVNFASKLTIFLVDVKVGNLQDIGDRLAHYLMELYKNDKQMEKALERFFEDAPAIFFTKLTDKSIIATLNTTQSRFAQDGYRFYNYIRDGILHTLEINRDVNFEWLFTMKVDKTTDYYYAGEKFKELLLARYAK